MCPSTLATKKKHLPIVLVAIAFIVVPLASCNKENHKDIDLPSSAFSEASMIFSKYSWPETGLGALLPVPESSMASFQWESSDGFCIYVGETTQEQFTKYADMCSQNGFFVDYRKGENYYFADDEAGNHLSLNYEGNNTMFVRIDAPNGQSNTGSDENSQSESNSGSSAITQESQTLENTDSQATFSLTDDNLIDVDISSCHAKYIKHEILENMAGDRCIAIYFEFTNNSEDNRTFDTVFSPTAFQDGVSLEESFYHVNDESKNRSAEIKPGTTVTVCSGYVLRNETSDVEVEMEGWISFSDKPDDTMTISLQ